MSQQWSSDFHKHSQWNDYENRGHIALEASETERFRMSNLTPIDSDLVNQNLAWVASDRLWSICLPPTSRHIYITMCMQTNMKERNYFGGLERLYQLTRLKRATVTKHLANLADSGLVEPQFDKKHLFKRHIRQNYHIFLPPEDILTCSDWGPHNQTKSHKTEYPKFLREMAAASVAGEIASDEGANNYPYMGQNGEVIHSEFDEIER